IQSPEVASFGLGNSPNPFNPETRLSFILPQSGRVQLDIYNLRGQLVRRLLDTDKEAGHHNLLWDGRDETGRTVGSGIYFSRIQQGSRNQVHKMMLVK
ncbi:MAG: FlgD immunoglobulin-like domain containing protein, partial [Candidatus Cloacimonadota bacterium]